MLYPSSAYTMQNFYPRPPRGGRLRGIVHVRLSGDDFYPRPPRGGRQKAPQGGGKLLISIHALREEGDGAQAGVHGPKPDFYPRPPRGGRPSCSSTRFGIPGFLSTPSARRATLGKKYGKFIRINISIHALREEGDVAVLATMSVSTEFLSTPSARRATRLSCPCALAAHISIHALREEGDGFGIQHRTFSVDFYPRPPRGGRPLWSER